MIRHSLGFGSAVLLAALACGRSQDGEAGSGGAGDAGFAGQSGAAGDRAGAGQSGAAGDRAGAGQSGAAGGTTGGTGGTLGSGGSAGSGGYGTGGDLGIAGASATCSERPATYPEILFDAAWLCGWTGGLDHFSWLIFQPGSTRFSGTLTVLDAECPTCIGYWGCEATGSFFLPAVFGSIALRDLTGCPEPTEGLTVTEVCLPRPGDPVGAEATMTVVRGTATIQCVRFALSRCDAALTTCGSPY
jgi:hypothetical protein